MHFDGKIPWQNAEALADILDQADPGLTSVKLDQPVIGSRRKSTAPTWLKAAMMRLTDPVPVEVKNNMDGKGA